MMFTVFGIWIDLCRNRNVIYIVNLFIALQTYIYNFKIVIIITEGDELIAKSNWKKLCGLDGIAIISVE